MIATLAAVVLAYTLAGSDGLVLATQTGRYAIDLGLGCDNLTAGQQVELLPGSGDVGGIQPLGSDTVCNFQYVALLDETPCLKNDLGDCDVALETP